ncbi:hypothetical protein MLD38_003608 [Melastoma candidum]|uniref:Uncharacterized protein n=1 Tax=Melastoma candidum TaxID=119954 RepID=A0ACB9S310_9MYRT|nr:hypothetical protein MLD38_003608 [Melastoma candidum]
MPQKKRERLPDSPVTPENSLGHTAQKGPDSPIRSCLYYLLCGWLCDTFKPISKPKDVNSSAETPAS